MAKSTAYYQLIPDKLLSKLSDLECHFHDIPGFSSGRLRQIISEIAFNIRKEKDKPAPLKMEYLRLTVPKADLYIRKLIELVVIERSGSVIKGFSSYKYRFTLQYNSEFKALALDDKQLQRRLEKSLTGNKKRNSKKYPGQNKWLSKLQIDDEAIVFIRESIHDLRKYNYAYAAITRIKNREIKYKIDKTAGRFHSNLTILPKVLRPYITINGIHLINIDVKNCQPFLTTLLLTNPKRIAKYAKSSSFNMILENLHVNVTEDVKKYVSLVISGEFYEYLWMEFEKNGLYIKTRDKVKKQVLIILFARNAIQSPARRIFKKVFPEVHRVFCLLRGNQKGNKFKNFKRFPILLQSIESHIMLDLILTRIHNEYPWIIAVTVHDSIMTGAMIDHVETVKKIMIDEFKTFVGHEPTLKIEANER